MECNIFSLWVMAITFMKVIQTAANFYNPEGVQYGVMMDAGSSGTKLKVYKWPKAKTLSEVPRMKLLHSTKFRPGIGHFARSSDSLEEYMYNITHRAKGFVPEDHQRHTPVYLMATAGARILDPHIALTLMNRIRNILSNSSFNPFRFNRKYVKILSGEEEGVYAWIAVNSLKGYFDSEKPPSESIGIMEMGGGSTQIAFIPDGPLYAGEFQIYLGRRRYDLYVHSYLFYGSSYMKRRVNKFLSSKTNLTVQQVDDPCRLKGDEIQFTNDKGRKVKLRGTGAPQKCADILRHFLATAEGDRCYPKPCAIGPVYQPDVGNRTFYASQGFVYTPENLRTLDSRKQLNISLLKNKAFEYCKKTLSEALKIPKIKRKYASDECLTGLYIPLLMNEAYGFDEDMSSITATNKIGDSRIDWTLGAMLHEQSTMFRSEKLTRNVTIDCTAQKSLIFNVTIAPEPPVQASSSAVDTRSPSNMIMFTVIFLFVGTV